MPDYPDTAFVSLPPDWVCEVLSASTRRLDLQEKRPVYAREGVGICGSWIRRTAPSKRSSCTTGSGC